MYSQTTATAIPEINNYFTQQQNMQLSASKSFQDEISQNHSELPISYQSFCKMFYNTIINTSLNDHTISILNKYTQKYLPNNQQYQISINNKTPIAQFLIDAYFQCVIRDNLTINEFMSKSKFLSSIPRNSRPWRIIRRHLTDYLKYMHEPINASFLMDRSENDEDDDDDEEGLIRHDMQRILYYTATIHDNLFILNRVCQVDMIFIPQIIEGINDSYFKHHGIKYKKLQTMDSDHHQYGNFWLMLRHFNETLREDIQIRRCIILIMSNSDNIRMDKVYIFEPLENNTVPLEIADYTEIPFIINSKADNILPDISMDENNGLSLSIHRHKNAERAYFKYKSYGTRVFKHNLKSVLEPFCNEESRISLHFNWKYHVKNKEFKDPQYNAVINTYFADLELIKPDLTDYFTECVYNDNAESRWSMELYNYLTMDNNKDYMYNPSYYEQYEQLNKIIAEHYKSMGQDLNDKFIRYINDNEFGDIPLDDNLSPSVESKDCAMIGFDESFPIDPVLFDIDNDIDRDEYIFYFIQHCYLFGSVPKPQYMMIKTAKIAGYESNVPGDYCYKPKVSGRDILDEDKEGMVSNQKYEILSS